jgi:hypothetical protein
MLDKPEKSMALHSCQEMVQSLVAQAVVGAPGKPMDGNLAGAWFRDVVYPARTEK